MPHKGRAGEIRRRGIGEAAGVGLDPVQQRRHVAGRFGGCGAVMGKGELDGVPRHLAAVDRHAKVIGDGRIVPVDQRVVGQKSGIAAKGQIALPHRPEILAVDPDQVDRACVHDPGLTFRQDQVDDFRRIGDRHPVQRDVIITL